MPENVTEALVGEAFNRLDTAAQRVMQALAAYGRPVPPVAVDYLLQPYMPGLDSSQILSRLANMHFARREAGRYYLHPVDRQYALSLVPKGEESDRFEAGTPVFSQIALFDRGADYFRSTRKPRNEWKTIEDLRPQLDEFDLRCEAEDWDTAGWTLREIDFDYLLLWGHARLLVGLHERLQTKISDDKLQMGSLNTLGLAHWNLGNVQTAITCYENGLKIARENADKGWEGGLLGNLGSAYSALGQVERAIEYYEQALAIVREIGDRRGEGGLLGNLGSAYSALGQVERAIGYYEQALAISREIGDRQSESIILENIGDLMVDQGNLPEAIHIYSQAIEIADDIGFVPMQNYGRSGLAKAHLFSRDLLKARATIEAACRYDVPQNNHNVWALYGVITLRQGDQAAAHKAFATAVEQADEMLAHTAQNYDALDAKGMALSGLAVCAALDPSLQPPTLGEYVEQAKEAFRAVRAITSAKGIVGRVLRLFDALAEADTQGVLAGVRDVIAGEAS